MCRFKYREYLLQILNNGTSNSDAKDGALRELRLLDSTRSTLLTVLILTGLALITTALAQCQLSIYPSQSHAASTQSTGKADVRLKPQTAVGQRPIASSPPTNPASLPTGSTFPADAPGTALADEQHDKQSDKEHDELHAQYTGVGLVVLWSLAIFAAGTFIGFLFGIPKIAQTSPPGINAKTENQTRVNPNTNLEQISDWLTKIIVGVGLVEARKIADQIHILMTAMANPSSGVAGESLALAIIITFSILGFFMGYLATRMFLSSVFNLADGMLGVSTEQKQAVLNADVTPGTADPEGSAVDKDTRRQAIAVVDATNDQTLQDPFDVRYLRAKSLLVSENFTQAALEYASLVAEKPNDIKLRRERLWALFKRGPKWSPEIAGILKAIEDLLKDAPLTQVPDVYQSLTFHYLYADTRESAQHVIDIVKRYRQLHLPDVPGILINEACAYGQLAKQNPPPEEFERLQTLAAEAVRRAIAMAPSAAERIRTLLVPTNPDNDLVPFNTPNGPIQNALTQQ